MKNLLACLAVLLTFSAGAQSTAPWNPDANDDSYVGATDMLSTLAVYGQQVGIDSSLTCNYDGTEFEEWLGHLWSGVVVLDSILVQYHVEDSALVFMPGCPDPSWDYVNLERSYLLTGSAYYNATTIQFNTNYLGYTRFVYFTWDASSGKYQLYIWDKEISESGLGEILGNQRAYVLEEGNQELTIPFLDVADFDEFGIHAAQWSGFLSNASYVSILPYWHYTE